MPGYQPPLSTLVAACCYSNTLSAWTAAHPLCLPFRCTLLPTQQGNQSPNKMLAVQSLQRYCQQECSKCVAAAQDPNLCPAGDSPLPQICAQGLRYNAMISGLVDKCANMYFNDNSSLDRALGC